ncbi:MAG: hypothetical protein ACXWNS_16605, partial [Isosphaeraceae bacterium]
LEITINEFTWLGWASIFSSYWMKPGDIKQIMSHHQKGLQEAKKTAGHGVMSSRGKGLGSEGMAREVV